jgi:acetyltransferase-like isoleucine patch superfamily enzyme
MIEDDLRKLHGRLDSEMRERWSRSLPLQELLSDRWRRAEALGFGEEASIYASSYVYGDVHVGARTWIGPFTLLDGTGGLQIGESCNISAGVQIYTHDTVKSVLSGGVAEYERAPVSIGNCCHIGAQTVIAKGVSIGDHCVIGATSFVNRDVPPFTIAVGSPCRPIGHVHIDEGQVSLVFRD